ncbi:MAG: type II toxin-antitoxin system RelE/ParE family toxin [Acidobacteriota bacterium]|nr:type II toxin-antitoxin system RelE/ParE family toxin [Acidobacteriota bacterium]
MRVQQIKAGARFTVYAWGDERSCEVLEFLEGLVADGDSDAKRITYIIERTADYGALSNTQHCRPLDDGIYEFKAPNTARVLWFYDAGRIIICTHGFSGKSGRGKTPKSEIERAKGIRELYLKEKKDAPSE